MARLPRHAGDVSIDEVTIITCTGHSQDITPQVLTIDLYEDIFAPFITGNVVVKDAQDLTGLMPLIGEEVIRIIITTPGIESERYAKEFMIYKMDDQHKLKDREVIYTLHFISKEGISDLNMKMVKGYGGGVPISAMVSSICSEGLNTTKPVASELTSNSTAFTANYWSPTKCINFLAEQALNAKGSPSYIFFENKHGFHFKSLETMYTSTPIVQRLKWDNYSADIRSTGGGSDKDIEKDFQRILEFVQLPEYNYMNRIKSGMYGSEVVYMDLMSHVYVQKGFAPSFEGKGHLNDYPLWAGAAPRLSRAVFLHEHQYYNAFDGYGSVSNTQMIQARKSLLAQAEGYKMTINVLGRTDYQAGQRMYLEIPKFTQIKKDDPEWMDKLKSGCYLISAICHKVTRAKHECTLELIKDSFMRDVKK